VDYNRRILVSPRTHIIFPYHKKLDQLSEKGKGSYQIGTTGRGIGPAYSDKYNRIGIRAVDLLNDSIREQKVAENINYKNFLLKHYYGEAGLQEAEMQETAKRYADDLRPYIHETLEIVHKYRQENKHILLEGAQGALLDVDYGSYPYVTSSHTLSGGCTIGSGIPPTGIDQVTGVLKVYQTRVGNGPFPTEDPGDLGEQLRKIGGEFGATTGRPRRCGWLDLVAARYSIMVNGISDLALTKLDVLDAFDTIYVCTSYKYKGRILDSFPADQACLEEVEPVYKSIPGWKAASSDASCYENLPSAARSYIEYIENACNTQVKYVSVGVRRDQIIVRG
jgi:adenylosuccinate synthase